MGSRSLTTSYDPWIVLTLLNLPKIGNVKAKAIFNLLTKKHQTPRDIAISIDLARSQYKSLRIPKISETDILLASKNAGKQIILSLKNNIKILTFGCPDYPSRLSQIKNPPLILFALGNVSCLNNISIAVIGTRKPTDFGHNTAKRIAETLANNNITVVSGLAVGCDSQAHIGCIASGGQTIAVLAHGLDTVHPKKNISLANEILESGGCLLSEYPIGTSPQNSYFVARDRIQSGLSEAVIVIETEITGGTMHTVKFSREQNRKLACISHPEKFENIDTVKGNLKLIEEGALILDDKQALEKLIFDIFNPRFSSDNGIIQDQVSLDF